MDFPFANLKQQCGAGGNHAFLELATNDGNSNYNALLVSLRHRYTRGFSYGLSYTWSHNIADYVDNLTGGAFPQNSYNYAAERGDSMFDVRQRLVGYLTYELPFGTARDLGPRRSNQLPRRWMADKFHRYRSDRHHDSTGRADTLCTGGNLACAAGLHRRCALRRIGRSPKRVLAESGGICETANGTFGNCGSGPLPRPGINQCGSQLLQNVPIRESMRLEFRAEAFNAFNHANFSNPNSFFSPTSSDRRIRLHRSTIGDPREIQFALKFYF